DSFSAYEDPGVPIKPEITTLTGIDDAMVAGQRIDTEAVERFLSDDPIILCHNANFDRNFFDTRFPNLKHLRWGCTLEGAKWKDHGFESNKLKTLLLD